MRSASGENFQECIRLSPVGGTCWLQRRHPSVIMLSFGLACAGFGDARLTQSGTHRVSSQDTVGHTSGPVTEAKGVIRNRLKVRYWLLEWKMLRVRGSRNWDQLHRQESQDTKPEQPKHTEAWEMWTRVVPKLSAPESVSWKTVFSRTRAGAGGGGFEMIHLHDVHCALYFQSNAIADLTGGNSLQLSLEDPWVRGIPAGF